MEKLNREELIELSEELKEKITNLTGLTPEEQCKKDHAGKCGVCDKDGYFTPCG